MPEPLEETSPEFQEAFQANEREDRINTVKVGCALVFFLMPAGTLLDRFVYPDKVPEFLYMRLLCSALVAVFWYLHTTAFGRRHYRYLGLSIPLLPAFFICLMIYVTDGVDSPYYAGLNLILLAASVVVHWNLMESLLSVLGVMVMYFAACYKRTIGHHLSDFVNNYYFLVLTGIIVVTGNYIFNRLRYREFTLRFELDQNRRQLEANNRKLDRQNQELADAMQKLRDAESQLVQQEKMASLGVMSAGIIHEINNPLNYATTGLYTLRQKSKHIVPEQQADYEDILKDVEEGVSRVKNIVSDLRMFTHPNTDSHDQVEVAEVVEPVLRFLSGELKDKVLVEQQWPEHQSVRANKQKLIHVLTNLMQNSVDALKTKTFTGEDPTIWITGRVENGLSLLSVRDNGPGIESKHVNKIFDPFYTTKDVGEGMGLGLSICYRIMNECNGRISVNTESGKFCEFTLEFPAEG
jgi:two-component system, sensor histidine kinase PhcS